MAYYSTSIFVPTNSSLTCYKYDLQYICVKTELKSALFRSIIDMLIRISLFYFLFFNLNAPKALYIISYHSYKDSYSQCFITIIIIHCATLM